MITPDYALIRTLEIMTKKRVSGPLLADSRSTLKGSGFEFHQLRDYVQGDDIRFIDWKSSARSTRMLVRQYLEDRNRTLYVVVDVSASTRYGTSGALKSDLIKELAATLAFVGLHKNDSVGLLLFTQEIELVIPPRQGRAHVYSLVQKLFGFKPNYQNTKLEAPLEYLARLRGKKALVCFISDFMGTYDHKLLSLVAHHHDLLLFRCLDERELSFPSVGMLVMEDSETRHTASIEGVGHEISTRLAMWHRMQKEHFTSARADSLDLKAGKPFSGDLVRFLRTRIYG